MLSADGFSGGKDLAVGQGGGAWCEGAEGLCPVAAEEHGQAEGAAEAEGGLAWPPSGHAPRPEGAAPLMPGQLCRGPTRCLVSCGAAQQQAGGGGRVVEEAECALASMAGSRGQWTLVRGRAEASASSGQCTGLPLVL
jgi:hypothetical protein